MTNLIKLKLLEKNISSCKKCDLHKTRKQTVFSRGNPESYITIIGESGGEKEDEIGLPFVGLSGQLLDKAIKEVGSDLLSNAYICNIIKCRPPNNRTPTDDEINCCYNWLEEQIQNTNTKIIITLGNTATQTITNTPFGISKVRGKILRYGKILVIPSYHPSYILRCGGIGSSSYKDLLNDISLAVEKLKEIEKK